MWLYTVGSWLITVANVAFWILIFRRQPYSRLAKGYFGWSLFITLWSIGYGVTLSALLDYDTTLAWNRWCQAMATFIAPHFFHFACLIVRREQTARRFFPLYIGLSSLNALGLLFSPSYVEGLWSFGGFKYQPLGGNLYILFTGLFWVITMHAFWVVGKQLDQVPTIERRQIRLFLVGTGIAYTGAVTLFLQAFRIPLPSFGVFLILGYVVMTGYLVYRYRFLDVDIAVTRTGLLFGTYLVVLGVPFVVGWWGRGWLEARLGAQWWLVPLGLCTALATAGPFAYAYLRRQAEARLLREQWRYQRTLQLAARGMTRVRDLSRLSNLIARVVSHSVRLTHASLFLWDKTHERYLLAASHGSKRLALQSRYGLEPSHPLIRWLIEHRRVLTDDELARRPELSISQELANLGAVLAVPGLIERHLVGLLVLGPKLSGAGYSHDDLHAFSPLANEAAVAIENALSYEELVRANEQLKVAAERLAAQERLAVVGQFAAGMAHEIKNPLSAIKTFAEFLPEKYHDAGFRAKFFRIVQKEIDRIVRLVRDLSDFAKPAPPELQPVRLAELIEATLSLLSNQCLQQGVKVHTDFQDDGLMAQTDPQQLKQVLWNLCLNSLEAMPEGGELRVSTTADGSHALLRVSDTGCGMSAEQQRKIWDPFFTTKERGMGLGMAIVRRIIESHGGEVRLSSAPGQGTTIELLLPPAPSPAPQEASSTFPALRSV